MRALKEEEAATTSSTDVDMLSPQDENMRALKDNILKQLMATIDQDEETDLQDQSCSPRRQTLGERKKAEIARGMSRRPRHSPATPTEVMVLINSFVSCTCSAVSVLGLINILTHDLYIIRHLDPRPCRHCGEKYKFHMATHETLLQRHA